jgi:hypothetical protein
MCQGEEGGRRVLCVCVAGAVSTAYMCMYAQAFIVVVGLAYALGRLGAFGSR